MVNALAEYTSTSDRQLSRKVRERRKEGLP
jgi:hypothetical protein